MADRARRVGCGRNGTQWAHPQLTTHSTPCRGFRGPLRCQLRVLGGGSLVPVYPSPTHPSPIPRYTPPRHRTGSTADKDHAGTSGTCTYDRFDLVLGEPRVQEHTRYQGPGLVIYSI